MRRDVLHVSIENGSTDPLFQNFTHLATCHLVECGLIWLHSLSAMLRLEISLIFVLTTVVLFGLLRLQIKFDRLLYWHTLKNTESSTLGTSPLFFLEVKVGCNNCR